MTSVLGSFLARPPRYGIGAAAVPYQSDLPTYVRITDIDEAGRFRPSPRVSVDSPLSGNYCLSDGDLVVARTGASVGKSYRYRDEDGELVFAGFLINIRPDPQRLDPTYLSHVLQSKPYWNWVASESTRSGQPGINAQQLSRLPLDLPAIDVQEDVADKLANVSALAYALERLIVKKRAIKQGMMQELLSGRKRLPGFSGEWGESTIGSLARAVGGGTPSTRVPADWGGEIPWFTPAEIGASGAGLVSKSERSITRDGLASSGANLLPAGTVLVTSRASIGHTAVAAVPVATNQGFASLVPNSRRSTWFLYYWIQQNTAELESRAAGSTFLEISARKVGAIPIWAPSLDEQDTIGRTIRDADAEIAALERRLEATRAIKQGMMQELLTGRTLLVPSGVSA